MMLLAVITLLAILLVVYHHAGYPLILKLWARTHPPHYPTPLSCEYSEGSADDTLPSIALVIPAYNEAQYISAKLQMLTMLDYPAGKLTVHVICDGCTDDTVEMTRSFASALQLGDLNIVIHEHTDNAGKLARLNAHVPEIKDEIIAFTDASALISVDACLVAAAHFADPTIGGLSGQYRILEFGGHGQETYWDYQVAIKTAEDASGSVIGCHGACYFIRQKLFETLPADTVNDDFVIPMNIVRQGYRVRYDPRIVAIELEHMPDRDEYHRRRRIATGNVQQVARLWHLMLPKYGGVAFNFLSGKALRASMPPCFIVALAGSIVLAPYCSLFALSAGLQLLGYFLVLWHHVFPNRPSNKYLEILHYAVLGHLATLEAMLRMCLGKERVSWSQK